MAPAGASKCASPNGDDSLMLRTLSGPSGLPVRPDDGRGRPRSAPSRVALGGGQAVGQQVTREDPLHRVLRFPTWNAIRIA